MTKAEKAKRRRIMAEIDQKADCSGHNHGMAVYDGSGLPGFDSAGFQCLAMVAGMAARRKIKGRFEL